MTRWISVLLLAVAATAGCDANSAFRQTTEAQRLAGDLLAKFSRAGDASNRAVMAQTDEVSQVLAHEAAQATLAVQTDSEALAPRLRELGFGEEMQLLDRFNKQFEEYRELDRTILGLAVENTNVKAQQLSLGASQEAADAFRSALERHVAELPAGRAADEWHVKALAATAVASVREIQVLQARHIPEPDEAAMSRLEARMAEEETASRNAVAMIAKLPGASSRTHLTSAMDALNRLDALNSDIRTLSRRNTNVRSLALSLGQKRGLTAACDATLRALNDSLRKRGPSGTR